MEEEKPVVQQIEDKKENKFKFIKIVSGIFVLLAIVILIIVKVNNPDFSLIRIIAIGAAVLLIGAIAFYWANINKKLQESTEKLKEKDELPRPLTKDQIKPYIESLLKSSDYANHIKEWGQIHSEVINKNIIYYFELELLYDVNEKVGNKVIVIVNSHYPNTNLSMISQNASVIELRRLINTASMSPSDDPEVEEVETRNEAMGYSQKTRRIKPKKKEERKEKEEKKDIA